LHGPAAVGRQGRVVRSAGPRRARRAALAGFAVIGIIAGVFGGLHLGHEITHSRATAPSGAATDHPSAGRDGTTSSAAPMLDRAATAFPSGAADRGAVGMPRVGGAVATGTGPSPAVSDGRIGGGNAAAAAAAQAAVPTARTDLYVYWVTSSSTRSLLAREYRNVPDYGDPLLSAVQAVLRQQPLDGDYSSPWRAATTVSVHAAPSGITVTLSADAFAATGVSGEVAAAGLQQLVWTVTAAAQRDVPVTVLVADRAGFRLWGVMAAGTALHRDPAFCAAVWIDTPLESAAEHGKVRISGQGSAFEGTYRWTISRDGRPVAAGMVTGSPAGPGAGRTQFAVDVTLPAGQYVATVTADDPGQQEATPGWIWPATRGFSVS
jgi:hypothetical protein